MLSRRTARALWAPALIGVGLLGLLQGGPVVRAEHDDLDFRWEAPIGFEGPLVLRFTYSPTEPTWCRTRVYHASMADAESPVILWSHRSPGNSTGASMMVQPTGVHAEGVGIDTRATFEGRHASGFIGSYGKRSAPETWTVVASHVKYHDNPYIAGTPFAITMNCDKGGVVVSDIAASEELLTFVSISMDGTGAMIEADQVDAVVQKESRIEGEFASDQVVTHITQGGRTFSSGTLRYSHPGGEATYQLGGKAVTITEAGGPGRYAVEVSRVSAGLCCDQLVGLLFGLTPVGSFDEVLRR